MKRKDFKKLSRAITGLATLAMMSSELNGAYVFAKEGQGEVSEEVSVSYDGYEEEDTASISDDASGLSPTTEDAEVDSTSDDVTSDNAADDNATVSDDNAVTEDDTTEQDESVSDEESHELPYTYETDNCRVTVRKTNGWYGGYQGAVSIENISDKMTEDWSVSFKTDDSIVSVWNADYSTEDGYLKISAQSYNAEIAPGESVTVGFQASGENATVKDLKAELSYDECSETGIRESDISDSPYVYEYDDYTVSYNVTSHWSEYCNVSVTVSNKTDEKIDNWNLTFITEDEIINPYNAVIISEGGGSGKWIFKNAEYNQDIPANASVQFGFQVHFGKRLDLPRTFYVSSKESEVPKNEYSVDNNVSSSWDGGCIGELKIDNLRNTAIEDWVLTVQTTGSFASVWGADLTQVGDDLYEFECPAYGQNIAVGSFASVGYQFVGEDSDIEVMGLKERNGELADDIDIEPFDPNDIKIMPAFEDWSKLPDRDGDMLPDEVEDIIGTDPDDEDTDDDRLPDGFELLVLGTDSTLSDTDGDGVSDADEDTDSDGLSDLDEYLRNTDCHFEDSDEDDLTDGDEVFKYGTDPLKADTDDDTVIDSDEILLGLDPLNKADGNTEIHQTLTEDELEVNEYNDDFKVSIDMTASNNVRRYIKEDISGYSGLFYESDFVIGTPIYLDYTAGSISEGKISFKINESVVANEKEHYSYVDNGLKRLTLFTFNETMKTIVPVKCDYDESSMTISTDISNMGDLILVDVEEWLYTLMGDDAVEDAGEDSDVEDVSITPQTRVETVNMPLASPFEGYMSTEPITRSYNGHMYMIVEIALNWSDAKAYCEHLEGHLATINSEGEQKFIEEEFLTQSGRTYWLGGYAYDTVRNFEWITGETFNYTNWDPGEPNLETEKACHLYDYSNSRFGKWNNCPENEPMYFICEWDAPDKTDKRPVKFVTADENDVMINAHLEIWSVGTEYFDARETIFDSPESMGTFVEEVTTNAGIAYAMLKPGRYAAIDNRSVEKPAGSNWCYVYTQGEYSIPMYGQGSVLRFIVQTVDNNTTIKIEKQPLSKKTFVPANFTAIPKNFGAIDPNSVADYDGDGLKDAVEIDFELLHMITGGENRVVSLGEYYDYFGGGVIEDYNGAIYVPLYEEIFVLPIISSPVDKDSDMDYYPDDKDAEVLKWNPMYINDAEIDDSYVFGAGNNPKADDTSSWTDGVKIQKNIKSLEAGVAPDSVPALRFRRNNGTCYFTLTPGEISVYRFDLEYNQAVVTNSSVRINVTYQYKISNHRTEVRSVGPEADGSFVLKAGIPYNISISATGTAGYDVVVYQDNWVYAPNGGIWKCTRKFFDVGLGYLYNDPTVQSVMPSTKIYFSFEQLYEAALRKDFDNDDSMEVKIGEVADKVQVKWQSKVSTKLILVLDAGGTLVGIFCHPIGWVATGVGISLDIYSDAKQEDINDLIKIINSGSMRYSCDICHQANGDARLFKAQEGELYINKFNADFFYGSVEKISDQAIVEEMGLN